MKNVIYKAFALTLAALLLLTTPALAISDPTSGPTIERIDIYRHTLEVDDMLVLVQYHLDYATNPDETINQAYLGRFMDGTTELSNVAPYSYYDMGYDHGVFSMYLSTSEAPTWEGSYSVRFEGNPTLEWPGDPPSATSSTLYWHSTTTSQATKLLLSSQIVSVANQLSDYWSVALTEETSGGTKLSSYGEQYFTNAIPNLRAMCPNVFAAGLVAPEYEEEEYTQSYASTLMNRWTGTGVDTAFQNLSDWSTVPLEVLKGLIWFIPVGMIAFYASSATGDMRNALFIVLLTLPLGSLLGMLSLAITMVAALACIIALGYAIFYRRSQG